MAEPEDAVVPILRNIQSRLGDMERNFGSRFDRLEGKVDGIAERTETIEDYMTYAMGIQSQHVADIGKLKEDIAEVKRRIKALEDAR
jgi:hypothetical protein